MNFKVLSYLAPRNRLLVLDGRFGLLNFFRETPSKKGKPYPKIYLENQPLPFQGGTKIETMKNEILQHKDDPKQLEILFRSNKTLFKREFAGLYPELKGNALADFWEVRLQHETEEVKWGTKRELILFLLAVLVAGTVAKLPVILSVSEEWFYPRNIGFIISPVLTAYFAWKNKLTNQKIGILAIAILAGIIFINSLPGNDKSDTLILSCVHLGLFQWAILGFAFTGGTGNTFENRLAYLKYNGDLVVITTLILISGGILTGVTVGLFSMIGLDIKDFYFEYVVAFLAPAAPFLGTYLTQTNPHLVGRVSPVIAKIFSPLVLVMLVIYLAAMVYSGKNPYDDREFLMTFNALLIGVMAIIFFSVAENSGTPKSRINNWILFLLSLITIIVNAVALSAIVFRISTGGLTPNRAAVLGGNLLILINLLLVTAQLYKVVFRKAELNGVGKTIAAYLPVYVIWTIIVTFLFPLIFGFK